MATQSIFQNKFLSVAGQKERLKNVVQTIKSAVTGSGVQSNIKSNVVNKVLSTAASHPFITAGVAAAGITAVKYVPTIFSAITTKTAVGVTTTAVAGSTLKPLILGAAGGYVVGSSMSGSGGATTKADQTITPTFTPTQNTTTNTTADNRQFVDTTNRSYAYTYGANSPIYATTTADPTANLTPTQSVNVIPSATQDTSGSQDATSSATGSIGAILLGIGALYLLSKN